MGKLSFFLDTYAMIEISRGNANFQKFIDTNNFTSVFNLYELYFILLRDFNQKIAEEKFLEFKNISVKITDNAIFEASKFRLVNLKKHFSYADAIGYALSLENNFAFLTGDDAFKGMKNVEFVK